jgi:hypothetical protein
MIELRDRLRLTLAIARATPDALAALARLPPRRVHAVVTGRVVRVTVRDVAALAVALRCTPDWLLARSEEGPDMRALRAAFAAMRSRPAAARPRRRRTPNAPRSVLITASMARVSPTPTPTRRAPSAMRSDRLARLLRDAGISRPELTRVTLLRASQVDELCARRAVDPEVTTVVRIAAAIGCPVAWLLGFTDEAPRLAHVRRCFAARGGRVMKRIGLRDPFFFVDGDDRPITAPGDVSAAV